MASVKLWNEIQILISRRIRNYNFAFSCLKRLHSSSLNKKHNTIKSILSSNLNNLPKQCNAQGWVSGLRNHKEIIFIDLSDGTCSGKLQVVLPADKIKEINLSFGDAISIEGQLIPSSHPKQVLELVGESVTINGTCPPNEFPLKMRQNYPIYHLRHEPHLRPKQNIFKTMLRLRSLATHEVHNFFQLNDYVSIHTPVLTSNDCEGAGEVFTVQPAKKIIEEKGDNTHFFDRPVYLTVSSQLHLEAVASGMKRVYSFGPIFRAENTKTRQHLSEFSMIEMEEAFVTQVDSLVQVLEDLVKHVGNVLLEKCSLDLNEIHKDSEQNNYSENLKSVLEKPFQRLSYSEAIEILQGNQFDQPIKWGDDLLAEHEQFLVKYHNNFPVVVTYYPAKLKPFYMKQKEQNGQLVAECFDVLVPLGGELCGGSLREDSYHILEQRLKENGIEESLQWYLELRKFGCPPHGGFGIGFDRLLQFLLGVKHIRDVVPFPRWAHHCLM